MRSGSAGRNTGRAAVIGDIDSTLDLFEQLRECNVQSLCDPSDVLKAQIALPALNRSHKGPVNSTFVGKSLLGIALFCTQFPYSLS